MKTIFAYTVVIFLIFPCFSLAAGGEVNAKIVQESNMKNVKIIGTSNIETFKFGDCILKTKNSDSTVNTIINDGKIHGYVEQDSDIDHSTYINAKINTLENHGRVGTVIQEGLTSKSNIIIVNQ